MDQLYREIIIDRYENPHNYGKLEAASEAEEANLMCGDKLKVYILSKNNRVEEIKFEGGGCAISMAAIDLLADMVRGKTVEEISKIKGEEIEEMLGVELTAARKKCAYLGLEVIRKIVGSLKTDSNSGK